MSYVHGGITLFQEVNIMSGQDTLKTRKTLDVAGKKYDYFSLKEAEKHLGDLSKLPKTLKTLLENLLRYEDGSTVTIDDIKALAGWLKEKKSSHEIAYRPSRVLMQDFTGVPAVVDLAAMRDAVVAMDGNAELINPLSKVDLVIDHSVMVDESGTPTAFQRNVAREFERNGERYEFLRWGQTAFDNFNVVPPGTGICHQVNLEYLAKTVWSYKDASNPNITIACPDTLVGTDSHTTMINGLSVLGWGVGGIEAEAAMLGQPISMLIPEVVGFELKGELPEGATATDLVLTVVQMLRKLGVVGKFVEFYGDGLDHLSLADRATIANMAPEYGATCGYFPIDDETLNYLELTGRDEETISLVETYAKEQGFWRNKGDVADYTTTLSLDLSTIVPCISGPKHPQDRILLTEAVERFEKDLSGMLDVPKNELENEEMVEGEDYSISHGDVVIAAITSCTNTSNPAVLIGAGLVAKKAREKGLSVKPWVKTSLAPGSQVVEDYLKKAGLQEDLDALGFNLVGYGCTTCIGNSGPLATPISDAIEKGDLVATSVLSGNRNFEGRINPYTRANYLASPGLVVAYAIAGSLKIDVANDPLGIDDNGMPVFLADIWPTTKEIADTMAKCLNREMFISRYADVFKGPKEWQDVKIEGGMTYDWVDGSTYVKHPPFFEGMTPDVQASENIRGANALAILGDSVTTDHISPAGAIKKDSPAGEYLLKHQIRPKDFNSYGSRRGNHEVMMRGTFANIRIKNEMLDDVEGGYTKYIPTGEQLSIYDAAMNYVKDGTPLVVIGGKEYGTGSSRDWAAKGTRLLGVKAVITESFERIHRSNLVGMGVLPLQFKDGVTRKTLGLTGEETFDLTGLEGELKAGQDVELTVNYPDGSIKTATLLCRIDTADEIDYYLNGGILHYVLRNILKSEAVAA